MKSLRTTLVLLLLAALALAAARFVADGKHGQSAAARAGEPEVDGTGRTAAEKKAIGRAARAGYRPAEDDDGLDSESRQELQDVYVDYHPYFVRGDLDGDGRLDFAQAYLYKVGGESRFDVAVFFGNTQGTFNGPVFVERGIELAPGDIAIERTVLILTPDVSKDDTRRWRYDGRDQRFHDADQGKQETEEEEDTPEEGPDARPRARV